MIVMIAVITHAAISSAGDPTFRLISAETMNMPEPIIDPTTIAVALKRSRPWTRCVPAEGAVAGVDGLVVGTLQIVLPEKDGLRQPGMQFDAIQEAPAASLGPISISRVNRIKVTLTNLTKVLQLEPNG